MRKPNNGKPTQQAAIVYKKTKFNLMIARKPVVSTIELAIVTDETNDVNYHRKMLTNHCNEMRPTAQNNSQKLQQPTISY
jgi:hypothetical protein